MAISCLTQEAYIVGMLLERVREELPHVKIVMGNLHSSLFADYYLKKGLADIVVNGEGEEVMVEVVKAFREGAGFGHIEGISIMEEGKFIQKKSVKVENLDSLPFPAWEIAPLDKYRSHFYYNFNPKRTRIMITSRGRPIGCSFCSIHEGQKVRYQSTERILEEIEILKRDYGTTHINFLDPMFLSRKSRVREICEGLLKENIDIRWACEAHVNYADDELFALMRRAGCETMFFGVESGNDELLRGIGKRTTTKQIEKAILLTRRNKIKPVGFFMLGLPGETEDMTKKTIDFSTKLPLDMAVFSITVPYPGSQMFEDLKAKDKNFDPYNWNGFNNTGILGRHPPVWSPNEMSYESLKNYQALAMRQFHFRPMMVWRHVKTFKYATFEDIKSLFNVARMVLPF